MSLRFENVALPQNVNKTNAFKFLFKFVKHVSLMNEQTRIIYLVIIVFYMNDKHLLSILSAVSCWRYSVATFTLLKTASEPCLQLLYSILIVKLNFKEAT